MVSQLRRLGRQTTLLGIAALTVATVGVVVAILTLRETQSIDEGVEALAELTPQDVVDALRLGMDVDEVAALLESDPVVDEISSGLQDVVGETVRRVLFVPAEWPLFVTVLADGRGEVKVIAVTARTADVELTFPLRNTGDLASAGDGGTRFRTNVTTLGDVHPRCQEASFPFGAGASWGYFAIGCDGYGFNNFDANAVAVNWAAEGYSPGLARFDLAQQLGMPDLDDDVAAITFNTLIWAEASGAWSTGRFTQVIPTFEFGPHRADPLS